jgi:c-di-GMP-binding flagellar brake protein YcgR
MGFAEQLLARLRFYPFRCQFCNKRFMALQWGQEAPASGRERRKNARTSVECAVTFFSAEVTGEGMVTDLSSGGCFIKTDASVPEGTAVALQMELANQQLVKVDRAVVRRSFEGLGVQFVSLRESEEAQLIRYLGEGSRQRVS